MQFLSDHKGDEKTERKRLHQSPDSYIKILEDAALQYKNLFNHMINGFGYHRIIVDKNGQPVDYEFLDINPAFTKQTGLTRKQVIGKKVTDVIPNVQENPVNWIERYGQVALTGESLQFEGFAEGLQKYYLVSVYSDKKGYFTTIFTDITERKAIEEKLRLSESNYRTIMEQASDGILIIDKDGRYLDVNKASMEMLGVTANEIIGEHVNKFLDPEDLAENPLKIPDLLEGKTLTWSRIMVRKDGKKIDVEISATMLDDGRIFGGVRDVSDRKKAERQLEESEEKFRRISENSLLGVAIMQDNQLTYVNQTCCDIYGQTKNEFMSVPVEEIIKIIHPDDRGFVLNQISKKIAGHEDVVENYPYRVIHKNGEVRWVEIFSQTVSYKGRNAVFSSVIDITDKKNAEAKLEESEEKFRLLFENSFDPIFWVNAEDGIIINCNKAATRTLEMTKDEIIGELHTIIHPPRLHEQSRAAFVEQVNAKTDFSSQTSLYTITKKVIPVHLTSATISIGDQLIVQDIYRDITEIKLAEEKLRESQRMLNLAQNIAGIGSWEWDILTDEVNWSDALYHLFGIDKTNFMYHRNFVAEKLVHPADRDAYNKKMQTWVRSVIKTKKNITKILEFRIIRNNEVKRIRMDGSFIFENGEPVKMIGTFQDITESKKEEAERLKIQKIESLSLLAGGIAHDYNNILVGILGNVNLLQYNPNLDNDMQSSLQDIEKATIRANDLTKQLLTFSKGGVPVKAPAHISEIVQDSVSLIMRGSKSRYELHVEDNLPVVEVDVGQISQMINNIIINAKQAMPNGGLLKIVAKTTTITPEKSVPLANGDYIKISIKDQGMGIPREIQDKIFDPYFTTKTSGIGLGLATSYSIAKQHEGLLRFKAKDNEGTTFMIYLPVSDKQVIPKSVISDHKKEYSGRVLIMDDDQMVQKTLSKILHSRGFSVDNAYNGEECIELYRKGLSSNNHYLFLVMDLTIPGGMGGKEAIQLIKNIDPNVKAIVSSGYSTDPIFANFQDYGFSAVLSKPYKISQLFDVINEIL
ncbi:MAG: PAS domain S-box protein [Candidatus Kariarchaeaceae archaeon]|jgi:PAS domain S-box-containing protein